MFSACGWKELHFSQQPDVGVGQSSKAASKSSVEMARADSELAA